MLNEWNIIFRSPSSKEFYFLYMYYANFRRFQKLVKICFTHPAVLNEWNTVFKVHLSRNFIYRISSYSFRPWMVSAPLFTVTFGPMYCDLWSYVLWPLDFQIQKRIVSAETIWGNTVYVLCLFPTIYFSLKDGEFHLVWLWICYSVASCYSSNVCEDVD